MQAARARKLEAQSKLDGLQKDIERLSSLSVEEVHTEDAQVEELQQVMPGDGELHHLRQ